MKKFLCVCLASLCLCLAACGGAEVSQAESSVFSVESVEESSMESSEEVSIDVIGELRDSATGKLDSLTYTNNGRMGDLDGTAFAIYSPIGYNGASGTIDLKNAQLRRVLPDGRFINAYAFFGVDVYSGEWWQNCVDVGFCRSGQTGKWHLFYNMYEPLNEGTNTWYESSKTLPDDIYDMTFTMEGDQYVRLTVTGRNRGRTDTVLVEVKGAKADGSNTAFLFNAALDYPPDTMLDREGNPCSDFVEITLACTDLGLYFRNLYVSELKLYSEDKPEGETWTSELAQSTGIWPDQTNAGFDYAPTTIYTFDGSAYVIDFDMNRKKGE
ncbi:MAG: hypothetical protein E7651_05120 [Ruminococcaceae bacterium]|nr:hypothetical protein [Oscillospiraceae bacterium]